MGRCKRVLLRLAQLLLSGLGIPVSALLSLKVGNPAGCKIDIDAYQLVMFAFVDSIVLVCLLVKWLTGTQPASLPSSPVNTKNTMWAPLRLFDGQRGLHSADPLENQGFHYALRVCVALMLLNLLWLMGVVQAQCTLSNTQEILLWVLAGVLSALGLPFLVHSISQLFKFWRGHRAVNTGVCLATRRQLFTLLKNPELSLGSKLHSVLSSAEMNDSFVKVYLAALVQTFSWRIRADEIKKLETIRNTDLRKCIICDTEFQKCQRVMMYPVEKANIGYFENRRFLRSARETDPDRLLKTSLKVLKNTSRGIMQLIHPQPSSTLLEMVDELQVIWEPPRSKKPEMVRQSGVGSAPRKKLVVELCFMHADCFCKVGFSARAPKEPHHELTPLSYSSAFSWATSRMSDLDLANRPMSAIPRYFGMLDTPVYDHSKHLSELWVSAQALTKPVYRNRRPELEHSYDSSSD